MGPMGTRAETAQPPPERTLPDGTRQVGVPGREPERVDWVTLDTPALPGGGEQPVQKETK